jgi:tetratricopeptide (TPR) repeat protein
MAVHCSGRSPFRRATHVACLVLTLAATGSPAAWQDPAPAQEAPAAVESSSPPVVIEHYRSAIVVAPDGSTTRDTAARVRVATSDGLAEAGTMRLPFERDMETLTVRYVRVRKANGGVVETPVDTAIDVPDDITREAPSYTDLYERHINVRGLALGDVIEYDVRSEKRPLLPGHFTLEEEWLVGEAVVDGEVTLSVPTAMGLIVRTHGQQPATVAQGARTVYRWTVSHPGGWTPEEIEDLIVARRTRRAAVQVSSFRSWAQVGESVRELWRDRSAITPEIREKAGALVSGKGTDAAKIAAIYDFVSRDVRYVAVSFGVGRLQPHPANDVLRNGFGDCKDKHVLLEALLRAAGFESSPVLVAPGMFLDTAVPSTLQFSHVITRVDTAGGPIWLDGTVAPAPVGYLPYTERDRDALLVPAAGVAALVRTPSEIPRPTGTRMTITGALDARGTLSGRVESAVSGDLEFALRTVLRQLPESQRVDVMRQGVVRAYGGTVSDVVVSDIDDVSGPLVVTASVSVADYSRWDTGWIQPLLPPVTLPDVPTGRAARHPFDFGFTTEVTATSRLQLPEGYDAEIDGKPSFERSVANAAGRHRLVMTIEDGVLVADSSMHLSQPQLPTALFPDYAEYRKVATTGAPFVRLRDAWPWTSVSVARFENPEGQNPQATQLVAQARRSTSNVAVGLLRKAVAIEPTHPSAWSLLGEAISRTDPREDAEQIMRRQIDVASSADAYKRIGTTYMSHLRWGVAIAAFREGMAKYPGDRDMPALLGEALLNDGRAQEAVPVLEAEAGRRPRSSRLQLALGRAYLRSGRIDEGVAALHAAVVREAGPNIWSVAAHELAGVGRDLPRALEYAEQATARTLTENETNEFAKLGPGAGGAAQRLAFYYEALGRVLVAQEAFDRGSVYCQAAWDLGWRKRSAECLANIARVRKDAAGVARYTAFMRHGTSFYMPAGAWDRGPDLKPVIPTPPAEARANYEASLAIEAKRTFKVPRPRGATGRGNFEMITGPDGAVREARLFSSAPEYEALVGDLLGRVVGPVLPEGGNARLIRIARVVCDDGLPPGVVTTSTVTRMGPLTSRQQETAPTPGAAAMCAVRLD